MKTLTLDVLVILLGAFIIMNTGQISVFGTQDQNRQLRERMNSPKNYIDIDHLPEAVLTRLEQDYEGWNLLEAIIENNGEEIFYEVELINKEKDKTKIIKLTSDGTVIGEEDRKRDDEHRNNGRTWFI